MELEIRDYLSSDAVDIANLFYGAVHAVADDLYSVDQKNAWAPKAVDYSEWSARLSLKQPFVAVCSAQIVGFIELEADGHIDCLYVHRDFQRRGVAAQLLQHTIQAATDRGIVSLFVEASKSARALFEKFGFSHERINQVHLRGQPLINHSMIRVL